MLYSDFAVYAHSMLSFSCWHHIASDVFLIHAVWVRLRGAYLRSCSNLVASAFWPHVLSSHACSADKEFAFRGLKSLLCVSEERERKSVCMWWGEGGINKSWYCLTDISISLCACMCDRKIDLLWAHCLWLSLCAWNLHMFENVFMKLSESMCVGTHT